MLVKAVKHALEKMDPRFLRMSGLIFDPNTDEFLRQLGESQEKLLERPFAYEFYHQMRHLWDIGAELVAPFADVVIQGEVDKGYQTIRHLDRIPDFLLHRPNSDARNFAVIEVKLAAFANRIEQDFDKFVSFRNRRGYAHLVEIVIGRASELDKARLRTFSQQGQNLVDISVILFNTDTWQAMDFSVSRVNPDAH
jgi:hypothetical protein